VGLRRGGRGSRGEILLGSKQADTTEHATLRTTVDDNIDDNSDERRRTSTNARLENMACLRRFPDIRERQRTHALALWLRRSRVRAPSVSLHSQGK
jgi:hypothetical protein